MYECIDFSITKVFLSLRVDCASVKETPFHTRIPTKKNVRLPEWEEHANLSIYLSQGTEVQGKNNADVLSHKESKNLEVNKP